MSKPGLNSAIFTRRTEDTATSNREKAEAEEASIHLIKIPVPEEVQTKRGTASAPKKNWPLDRLHVYDFACSRTLTTDIPFTEQVRKVAGWLSWHVKDCNNGQFI